mgnify:CR=1 FL=1
MTGPISAIGVGFAAIAAGLGIGLIGSSAMSGIARQPELAPQLQTKFFVIMGLVDAVPMIAVGLGMFIIFSNPFIDQAKENAAPVAVVQPVVAP